MSSEIKGLKHLEMVLNGLSEGTKVKKALEQAGGYVENLAKRNCPVDTGQLKGSITHEVVGNSVYIGTNVEYAPYVHQGTGIYAVNGDGRKTKWSYQDAEGVWHSTLGQKPQPFLEDALTESVNNGKIEEIFSKELKQEVKGVLNND